MLLTSSLSFSPFFALFFLAYLFISLPFHLTSWSNLSLQSFYLRISLQENEIERERKREKGKQFTCKWSGITVNDYNYSLFSKLIDLFSTHSKRSYLLVLSLTLLSWRSSLPFSFTFPAPLPFLSHPFCFSFHLLSHVEQLSVQKISRARTWTTHGKIFRAHSKRGVYFT